MDGSMGRSIDTFVPDESHVGVEHHKLPAGVFELLRPGPPERRIPYESTTTSTQASNIVVHVHTEMEQRRWQKNHILSSMDRGGFVGLHNY